jgi:hypothetical protein
MTPSLEIKYLIFPKLLAHLLPLTQVPSHSSHCSTSIAGHFDFPSWLFIVSFFYVAA